LDAVRVSAMRVSNLAWNTASRGRVLVLDILASAGDHQPSIADRPYWTDIAEPGSLNFAQLLVGSEGTLAVSRRLHLHLSVLPRARVLRGGEVPDFQRAMQCTAEIVRLGPTAVELVDRTMIDLALANPAFRPVIETALLTDETQAILLVEFAGESVPTNSPLHSLDSVSVWRISAWLDQSWKCLMSAPKNVVGCP
jgi:FAD/FMN-containing dehydrogenase